MKIQDNFKPFCDNCTAIEPVCDTSIIECLNSNFNQIVVNVTCENIEKCTAIYKHAEERLRQEREEKEPQDEN